MKTDSGCCGVFATYGKVENGRGEKAGVGVGDDCVRRWRMKIREGGEGGPFRAISPSPPPRPTDGGGEREGGRERGGLEKIQRTK
jgi:hypothetical protein